MSRPTKDLDDDPYDDPDINIGDFVYSREMKHALKEDDSPPVSLFFQETAVNTGPVWTEGFWDSARQKWWTAFGYMGEPIAWAPLPKTKD